jgi:hypothetical protein
MFSSVGTFAKGKAMRRHTFLVLVLAFLCLGMGRPRLGIVNASPPASDGQPPPKSVLISLRHRQELHRLVRLLAQRSASAFHTLWIVSDPVPSTSLETPALSPPSAEVLLQLLMRLQE